MTIDWRAAAELPARELEGLLLDEADSIMAGLSDEDEDRMLASLAEPLRAIWLLNWLDFEVCQGSLLAYFFNRHGRHATLATEVLRKLGASRMADSASLPSCSPMQACPMRMNLVSSRIVTGRPPSWTTGATSWRRTCMSRFS